MIPVSLFPAPQEDNLHLIRATRCPSNLHRKSSNAEIPLHPQAICTGTTDLRFIFFFPLLRSSLTFSFCSLSPLFPALLPAPSLQPTSTHLCLKKKGERHFKIPSTPSPNFELLKVSYSVSANTGRRDALVCAACMSTTESSD